MTNVRRLICLLCITLSNVAVGAGGSAALEPANNDLGNVQSLQRGAKYFVNYCLGCHSAQYVRFARIAQDLQLSQVQLVENLMFSGDKPHDTIRIAMPPEDAERWFGRKPPDLSLVARSRGADWVFNYLKSFYIDDTAPQGVDNIVLPGVSMPHVLWELQGLQKAVFKTETDADGNVHEKFEHFEPVTEGRLSASEFDALARDLTNFLAYISEPVQMKRRQLGIWVMAFLIVLFFLTLMLKKEFWKDIH